ncbi:hypothetical protein [Lyngbya aestuarii]|uniref:hypothetical protein n=1 Tax=Lyngbya aestuarii TaxID=118322 RepID=UPI00403DF61E
MSNTFWLWLMQLNLTKQQEEKTHILSAMALRESLITFAVLAIGSHSFLGVTLRSLLP